jgi:sugar phosphate isomerase/epimerase
MKIAFSTVGCPDWSWEDIISTAKDLKYDGIEIRGIGDEMYAPKIKPFLSLNQPATMQKLQSLNLKIACLATSCYLFDKEKKEAILKEGMEYIDLAQKLSIPFIRVLGDKSPESSENVDIDYVVSNLLKLCNYCAGKNVTLLLETNGVFANSEVMLNLIERFESQPVGILWDIHHPYRFFHEEINTTYGRLGKYIKHVHIKDSVIKSGTVNYKLTGYGDIPVKEAIFTLKENKFDGFISLEWVKRWCSELEDPGIVYSQFISYISDILGR